MKIAVIGTGMVGRAVAGRLAGLGHDVVIGTRDVANTLARTEPDALGTPPFSTWQPDNPQVRLVSFPDAGAHGEVVINATAGVASVAALEAVGAASLAGKTLVDIGVPLDASQGMPPLIDASSTDSLAERIQRAVPEAHVVKTLSTVFNEVMIDPARLPGQHTMFLAGNDEAAKKSAKGLLAEFGWPEDSLLDLGDLTAARAIEMYMRLFFTLAGVLGSWDFNINVVRG